MSRSFWIKFLKLREQLISHQNVGTELSNYKHYHSIKHNIYIEDTCMFITHMVHVKIKKPFNDHSDGINIRHLL
jgi:hypothetical protein